MIKKKLRRALGSIITLSMIFSLFVGLGTSAVYAEGDEITITFESAGGTTGGSMEAVTLPSGTMEYTMPQPAFTPEADRTFAFWIIRENSTGEDIAYATEGEIANLKTSVTSYTAVAFYGYEVTINPLPEGLEAQFYYNKSSVGIVSPEACERGSFVASVASFLGVKGVTSENSVKVTAGDMGYTLFLPNDNINYYVPKNIMGPCSVTVEYTDPDEEKFDITLDCGDFKADLYAYTINDVNLGSITNDGDVIRMPSDGSLAVWSDDPFTVEAGDATVGELIISTFEDHYYRYIKNITGDTTVTVRLDPSVPDTITNYYITLESDELASEIYSYDGDGTYRSFVDNNQYPLVVSEGGYIEAWADEPFDVTIDGATAGELIHTDEGYCREISDLTKDTTLTITPHICQFSDWEITVQPTADADGERMRVCSCGKAEKEAVKYVPETEADNSKGDNTNTGATLSLVAFAVSGAVLTLSRKRK